MVKINKTLIKQLQTDKGGFSNAVIEYAKEITGSNKFKRGLEGFEATEKQWEKLLKLSGYTRRQSILKRKQKKAEKILNPIPKAEGWAWKPPKAPEIKRESKNHKNQGKKAKRREFLSYQAPNEFYSSREWLALRIRVLEKYECKCMMCGRSPQKHGIVIHVDHIKPRSKFPELSLVFDNLQLLCEDCNIGKSNKYQTDWRPDGNESDYEILSTMPVTMQ